MVVNSYRCFAYDTTTGKIMGNLPVVDPKWSLRVNAAGTITASVPATSREVAGLDIKAVTTPLRRSLAFSFGGTILEAGPVLRRRYDEKTRRLELTAKGLWSIFDRRKALPGWALRIGVPVSTATLSIGPTSMGSIARELVRVSIQDNYYGLGTLPVVLPEVIPGDHVRNYEGYDLRWIGEALRQLTTAGSDGPDIRFRPRFRGDDPTRVEHVLETGTPGSPLLSQSGPDWLWDGRRPKSDVVGFGAEESAESMAARAWVPGNGTERDMLVGAATDLSLASNGWPWTEVDNASKQEESLDTLNALALADLAQAMGPEEQFSITVRADGVNALGEFMPGDFARVVIPDNHPLLDPGPQRVRIMGLDGGWDNQVKITVAPFIGAVSGSAYAASSTVASADTPPDVPYPDANLYPSYSLYPA